MDNNEYNSGYGQCRSDLMAFIKEAVGTLKAAMDEAGAWSEDPEGQAKVLRARMEELRRIRAYVKTMKPKR